MGFLSDFKTFATKGNLVDIAIGFLMGTAFTKLVTGFTTGLVSPIIGLLSGGKDFSKMEYVVKPAVVDAAGTVVTPAVSFQYGMFFTTVLDFIIIAFVCYLFIKAILRKDPNAAAGPSSTDVLLTEIRDELRRK
ncbi:large conductance mechanosensitive channel protein MscL [Flavihumibacter sediminis]|nr:large conductance mechanosensitive channel protein MscL [Flavihumibacter sediminis]